MGRTAHAEAAAWIRQRVLAGEFPAGTRLVQDELARQMKTSITPVREALRELAAEGLIEIGAFRGAVVHTPTLPELEELYAVRHELVPIAIRRRMATITADEVEAASELADLMRDEPEYARWVEMNRQFHRVFDWDPEHSPRLSVIVARLADLAALYVNISIADDTRRDEADRRRGQADREHVEIVDGFRSRDLDATVAVMRAHFARTLQLARESFAARDGRADGAPGPSA